MANISEEMVGNFLSCRLLPNGRNSISYAPNRHQLPFRLGALRPMTRVHILHENSAWLPPLAEALDRRRLPWTEWFLDAGAFDLSAAPPEGVFYNRMSASSHTRDHRFAAELTAGVLAWLARWDRRVVNGSGALDLEISK